METVEHVLRVLEASPNVTTVDITGGAPEMSPAFWPLVRGARALGREVIDRCNLTVLFEPGMEVRHHVTEAAAPCGRGCTSMWHRLHLHVAQAAVHVAEAAAPCGRGCSPM